MADFTIRVYKNRDYNSVRSLFAAGMMEHLPATWAYLLKLPRTQFVLFVFFITVLLLSRSYLFSLFSLVLVFIGGRRLLTKDYQQYVERSQREDLLHIEESYMATKNSCFWVAESNGRVVGMVGAQSLPCSGQVMQLRRLSVARDQRHKGIAKALCTTVIDFARERGYTTLTLETSMIQRAAHKLYASLGFQKTDDQVIPSLFARFANFSILTYEFKIINYTIIRKDMPDYSIRKYNGKDYHSVRELFAQGMLGYIPGTTLYLLKLPQVYGTIFLSVVTIQLVAHSFFLSLLSIGAFVALVPCVLTFAVHLFVRKCHNTDLLDIYESYIRRPDSCFWVAETRGRIVGMVGVQPAPDAKGDMILRRLSVAKEQQRRGVARDLCMTVIDFAHQRGYRHVTLDTSTIQVSAHKLYQSLGFRTTKIVPSRSRLGRMVNLSVVYYSYAV
ncbi:uncharacterized protein PAF06_011451 [Gastrophryne carolinensis]